MQEGYEQPTYSITISTSNALIYTYQVLTSITYMSGLEVLAHTGILAAAGWYLCYLLCRSIIFSAQLLQRLVVLYFF